MGARENKKALLLRKDNKKQDLKKKGRKINITFKFLKIVTDKNPISHLRVPRA